MNPRGAAAQRFLHIARGSENSERDRAHRESASHDAPSLDSTSHDTASFDSTAHDPQSFECASASHDTASFDSTAPQSLHFDTDDFDSAYLGWEIARCAPGLSAEDQGVIAAIAASCLASIRAGNTRLPIAGPPFEAALAAVGAAPSYDAARMLIAQARGPGHPITAIVGRPGERKPLILEGDWLYAERMHLLEQRFCDRLEARLASGALGGAPPFPGDRGLGGARDARTDSRGVARAVQAAASAAHLTEEQTSAVREALRSRLALIRGGPGTGKTTAVVALIRAIAWLGMPTEAIAIAAPTGKAAARISEAIAQGLATSAHDLSDAALRSFVPSPLTLHRLLGWSPRTGHFAHHENDPLPHRLVIVDEASMIDLAMMDRLLRALRHDARLVLLGDADQLPSVEAGAVFRDLCTALGGSRLTTNLRVGADPSARRIVRAVEAVNSGKLEAFVASSVEKRYRAAEVAFAGVEHLTAPWSVAGEEVLELWWKRLWDEGFARLTSRRYRVSDGFVAARDVPDLRTLLAHHARARILCATRLARLATSADAINGWLVDRLREAQRHGDRMPLGTPFVVQHNDYARGLYNGDHGVVVLGEAAEGIRPVAVLGHGDRFEALPLESLSDIAPAFAMTVHKAQGSEFEDVLLVLPDREMAVLTRELVYTALSRARRSVLVVGDGALLARAIERTTVRFSGIAERLESARRRERPGTRRLDPGVT